MKHPYPIRKTLLGAILLMTLTPLYYLQAEESLDFSSSGHFRPEFIKKHAKDLALTPDQQAALQKTHAEAEAAGKDLKKKVDEAFAALKEGLKNAPGDEKLASEKLHSVMKADGDLKELQLRTLIRLRSHLTPEQIAKGQSMKVSGSKPVKASESSDVAERLRAKAEDLKALVEAELGGKLTDGLKKVGSRIEQTLRDGDIETGEKQLDQLITLFSTPAKTPDYSKSEPGELSNLKERLEAVMAKASLSEDVSLIRQLNTLRQPLEEAKKNEDAETAGRILSWAEQELSRE